MQIIIAIFAPLEASVLKAIVGLHGCGLAETLAVSHEHALVGPVVVVVVERRGRPLSPRKTVISLVAHRDRLRLVEGEKPPRAPTWRPLAIKLIEIRPGQQPLEIQARLESPIVAHPASIHENGLGVEIEFAQANFLES